MKAAALFIRCLENEGVEYVFGIPGEENLEVMDALLDSSIRFITVRHEQGAAFMADVYGRLTERAGVCLATLGPGATNLITGVADANMDHAPLVAIAGQAGTNRLHKESHQVLDLTNLFEPVTQYSASLLDPDIIPEVVRKAFKLAQSEKTGAAFIEFPENIAGLEVVLDLLPVTQTPDPEPPAGEVAAEVTSPFGPLEEAYAKVVTNQFGEREIFEQRFEALSMSEQDAGASGGICADPEALLEFDQSFVDDSQVLDFPDTRGPGLGLAIDEARHLVQVAQ